MQIEPLPKSIYERAIKIGVTAITLHFSGGSDEGFLDVELEGNSDNALANDIDTWAWEVYEYSGAGDGSDYGDDITYNLGTMKATHSEWSMRRHDEGEDEDSFGLADDSEEEKPVKRPASEILDDLVSAINAQVELDGLVLSPRIRELLTEVEEAE